MVLIQNKYYWNDIIGLKIFPEALKGKVRGLAW